MVPLRNVGSSGKNGRDVLGTQPCAASEQFVGRDELIRHLLCLGGGIVSHQQSPASVLQGPPHPMCGRPNFLCLQGPRLPPAIIFVAATSSAECHRITLPIVESACRPKGLPTPAAAHTKITVAGLAPHAFLISLAAC